VAAKPRVQLAAASWSFEQAALALLETRNPGAKRVRAACELLLAGVEHDLALRRKLDKRRKKARVSFRLYDLLAGTAVRYRPPEQLARLLEIVARENLASVLQSRMDKWQSLGSTWSQRWQDRNRPRHWRTDSRAVIF
jgi:hypothetical protein